MYMIYVVYYETAKRCALSSVVACLGLVNMLVKQFALELGSKGLGVFSLNPGWLCTDMGGPDVFPGPVVGGEPKSPRPSKRRLQRIIGLFCSIHI